MDPQIFNCDSTLNLTGGITQATLTEVLPPEADQNQRKGFFNVVCQTEGCIFIPEKHYVISITASEE